ncbi:MAG: class I SAM-dependent methyltransferase [Planctomycetota bacterium]
MPRTVSQSADRVRLGHEAPYSFDCFDEFLATDYAPESCRAVLLGCRDGRTAIYLARKGFAVLGIDPDRELLSGARERAAMADVSLDLMAGEPLGLPPLPEESFGLIVDLWTAAELPDGLERMEFLASLRKLLRRDGILISSAPAPKPKPRPKEGAPGQDRHRTYAFSNAFVSDFTRAGFTVLFEAIRPSPPGDLRRLIHARR